MPRKVKPEFTEAQARAIRAALSYAAEAEDGAFVNLVHRASLELERAYRESIYPAKGNSR